MTGKYFNLRLVKMSDPIVSQLLSEAVQKNDKEKLIELGFGNIDPEVLDILALGLNDADPLDVPTLNRL
jgi:hypothetical protein